MFKLLFDAASYTLLKFGKDEKYLGAKPGIIAVLHTWGQQLSFHPLAAEAFFKTLVHYYCEGGLGRRSIHSGSPAKASLQSLVH